MTENDATLQRLIDWLSEDKKCSISASISAHETSYGGRGIFADKQLEARQQIIKITPSYLLNFSTIVEHILSWSRTMTENSKSRFKLPETTGREDDITRLLYAKLDKSTLHRLTSFQIVAMYLCLEKSRGVRSWWKPFIDSLPPTSDFDLSPLVWLINSDNDRSSKQFTSLPQSTQRHADKMYKRFTTDYSTVQTLISSHTQLSSSSSSSWITRSDFLWAWFCVNSRCLYMSIPEAHTKDDNFTMAPFVDLINHSAQDHCSLQVDHNGFHVMTSSSYSTDEEVFLSYGPHSNEFLLCEYGFVLPSNPWNDVDLTEQVTALLSEHQCEFLKEKGYLGEYTINMDGISFRVEVALAVLLEKDGNLFTNRRINGLMSGVVDGKFYKRRADMILEEVLENVQAEHQNALDDLETGDKKITDTIVGLYRDELAIIDHHLGLLQGDQ